MIVKCSNNTYVFVDNEKKDNGSVNVLSLRESDAIYFRNSDRITRIAKNLFIIHQKINMHLRGRWRRSSVERQFKLAILQEQ